MTQSYDAPENEPWNGFHPDRAHVTIDLNKLPVEDIVALNGLGWASINRDGFLESQFGGLYRAIQPRFEQDQHPDLGKTRELFAAGATAESPVTRKGIAYYLPSFIDRDPQYGLMIYERQLSDPDATVRFDAYDSVRYGLQIQDGTPHLTKEIVEEISHRSFERVALGNFIEPSTPLPEIPLPEGYQPDAPQG